MICLKFSVCKSLMIWKWWTDIIVNHIDNCSDIICNIIDITLNNWHHKWAHWYHVWEKCLLFPDVLSLCHEDLWVLLKKKWTISINSYNFILQDTRSRWVRQSGGGMPPPRSRTGPPGPVTAAWSVWGTSVWI